VERALVIKAWLEAGLAGLSADGLITHYGGEGAIWGLSLPGGLPPVAARDGLLEEGVILRPIAPNRLAMCPPLVITAEQVGRIFTALRRVLTGR